MNLGLFIHVWGFLADFSEIENDEISSVNIEINDEMIGHIRNMNCTRKRSGNII